MYLSRLYIENYRSIKHLDISFTEGKNVIVGKNNAGKSNIISAIDLVLGESSPTYNKSSNILESDFFQKQTQNTIFIFCELKKHSGEILDFSKISSSAIFKISDKDGRERKFNIDLSFQEGIFQFCGEGGEVLIDSTYKKHWIGGKTYCSKSFNDEFYGIDNFAFAFRAFINQSGKIEKEIVFIYKKESESNWFVSTQNTLRDVIFQSAVIPSFRDPSNQLKISNWSWYGKILKEKIKGTKELEEAFGGVNKASEGIFSTVTSDIFDGKLQTAFPGTSARFSLAPLNQDIYKQALIYIDDGFESTLQSKGSGIQSAVIISLFDYYIKHIVDRNGSALLAVEEPELFLHPHGRRVIAHRLDQFIGAGTDKKNQVIVTTHASEFIAVANNNLNIISVRKESGETQANNYNFGEDRKIRQILLRPQNTELFFSDFVILTEDAKLFIEEIAREMGKENPVLGENWLNDNNISVVNSGGKQEFWKFAKICEELKIAYLILADFDFIRGGVAEFYTQMSNIASFKINKDKLNGLCGGIVASDEFIAQRLVDFSTSDKSEDEKNKEARKYKRFDQISVASQKIVQEDLLPILAENNIYLLNGELENLYKSGKLPSTSKEQGVIETLGKLDDTNKLSDFISDNDIRKILDLVTKIRGIKIANQVEFKSKVLEATQVVEQPFAEEVHTLEDEEEYFRFQKWIEDDTNNVDLPFK